MKLCAPCLLVVTAALGAGSLALLGGAGAPSTAPAVAIAAATTAADAAADAAFTVDGTHSSVVFKVKHNNVAPFYGRFNTVSGTFNLNKENPSASVLNITIAAESVDTNNTKRNDHLKSQDFFSAKEFPSITFVGKEFKKTGDAAYEVKGDLTLRGTTKSITVTIDDGGRGTARNGEVAGLGATFTINRGDFGVNFMLDKGISSEVTVMVGLEGGK